MDLLVGKFRWLTVVSPEGPEGAELLLEPSDNPAAKTFKEACFSREYLSQRSLLRILRRKMKD